MGQTAVIKEQIVSVDAKSLLANNTAVAAACQAVSWATASTGDVLTVQSNGTVAFAAVSAGIGGSTGSTDNLVLRADGAGGATLQNSGWLIPDIYTSSPNATVNHLSLQATGATTNVSVSIVPKGSGAFSLQVPDGTSAGGNARGANAIDLQTSRSAAANVASGTNSIVVGSNNRASADTAIAIGRDNVSSDVYAATLGYGNTCGSYYAGAYGGFNSANGIGAWVFGFASTAAGNYAFVAGTGNTGSAANVVATGSASVADRLGMQSHSAGRFAANGDCQRVAFHLRNKTTDGTTAVTLFLDGSSARLTIPSGKILSGIVEILGSRSTGAEVAVYTRHVAIKNVGGTTTLVGTVDTIGVDTAAGTTIAITADDTNDALQIAVTGVASQTWRWEAEFRGLELAYGT
jgi:hypothetical protein